MKTVLLIIAVVVVAAFAGTARGDGGTLCQGGVTSQGGDTCTEPIAHVAAPVKRCHGGEVLQGGTCWQSLRRHHHR
jgi:hypothetical protein